MLRVRSTATIARRLLVNYRVDPKGWRPAPGAVPAPTVSGGVGGVCFIALRHLRPAGIPLRWGFAARTSLHRFAVSETTTTPAM